MPRLRCSGCSARTSVNSGGMISSQAEERKPPDDSYTDEETARRRDEVIQRMLNTPPQPRRPMREPKERPARKTAFGSRTAWPRLVVNTVERVIDRSSGDPDGICVKPAARAVKSRPGAVAEVRPAWRRRRTHRGRLARGWRRGWGCPPEPDGTQG